MDKTALIIWTKQKEIEALNRSNEHSRITGHYQYWHGKAEGLASVWEYLVFGGKTPHPERYNQENDYWSKVAQELASRDES